ncbi:MAG: beta-lactamase family protein [Acidobacteria bacterium]|nr:beta-lactamase family protein [Acidobacteriota bacterium]
MTLRPDDEAWIAAELSRAGVPGAALAWITRSGASGHVETGFADLAPRKPVEAGTRFHLFSGTKLYTATAVMCLVESGAIALDAPVKRYLPDLLVRDELTVAHLLSHASGLPDSLRAFLSIHLAGDPIPTTADALARYRLTYGQPGGRARYGNVNYAILGELVSRVAGEPFTTFVDRALLRPLGAELTFEDDGVGSAVGYVSRFSPMLLLLRFLQPGVARRIRGERAGGLLGLRPFSLDTAAIGGLVGRADAFLPLLREMLAPDSKILRASSKAALLTPRSHGAAGIVSREGVALGWKLGVMDGRRFFNHEGGGPGFATETRLYPDEGVGVVLLMNLTHDRGLSRLAHRICERLRERLG